MATRIDRRRRVIASTDFNFWTLSQARHGRWLPQGSQASQASLIVAADVVTAR